MQLDWMTVLYVVCGITLPLFYVPQIRRCRVDETGLASFSMTKAGVMTALRLAMLPFVFRVGVGVMTFIVALDTAGRLWELVAASQSLRRQGWTHREILWRVFPFMFEEQPARNAPSDATPTNEAPSTNTSLALPTSTSGSLEAGQALLPPLRTQSSFMILDAGAGHDANGQLMPDPIGLHPRHQ